MLCRPYRRPHNGSAYTAELSLFLQPLRLQFLLYNARWSDWPDATTEVAGGAVAPEPPPHCSHSILGRATRWSRPRMREAFLSLFQRPRPSLSSLHWEQICPFRVPLTSNRAGLAPSWMTRCGRARGSWRKSCQSAHFTCPDSALINALFLPSCPLRVITTPRVSPPISALSSHPYPVPSLP
ncbi:hypothetical protein MDA_GLEAN10015437 [Myotis davidii]|uniref:Uncharacterized protein n=1 Tax=Myotis davidii TaxID=225400 RepID=L5MA72_MYODS|nr:hypothetical protein MDA_GLEAN10015437 [Myotis davidii]